MQNTGITGAHTAAVEGFQQQTLASAQTANQTPSCSSTSSCASRCITDVRAPCFWRASTNPQPRVCLCVSVCVSTCVYGVCVIRPVQGPSRTRKQGNGTPPATHRPYRHSPTQHHSVHNTRTCNRNVTQSQCKAICMGSSEPFSKRLQASRTPSWFCGCAPSWTSRMCTPVGYTSPLVS